MEFNEVLARVLHLLQREGRLSYRALKLRFNLDDDYIEALKDELIAAKQQAVDEDGKVLVWTAGPVPPPAPPIDSQPVPRLPVEDLPEPTPPGERVSLESPPITPEAQVLEGESSAPARRISDAERRQLTVMFSDLVESTALSGQLDPEDLREVVRAYQATCAEIIQHFDGHIAQYLGDSLLVYYGYPHAHEDDPQRAIRTGLGIVEAVRDLNTRLEQEYGVRLLVRIGIHTGLVVVGDMGGGDRHEQLALGEPPNVTARIQELAAPDTVVISAATYRLTRGYFVCQDLGRHTLKGVTAPLHLYRVFRESGAQDHLDVVAFTTLVGREEEVRLLLQRWERSKGGLGQVVMLCGEAGIGKSRLVVALREQIGHEGHTRMVFRCSPYHMHSAFHAVIDYLQRLLQWRRDDTPEAKLVKLERMLQAYRFPPQEVVPLFAALLSVPLPKRYPPLGLSPQGQKQKTREALVTWLLEEAERQPVLVVWEGLHWADASTLEMLGLLIDQAPTARMLILLTFRPEFHRPWVIPPHLTQITLSHLEHRQAEQIVAHMTHGKALPHEVLQQIIAKTDGVPLFVEELVKMVLESGLVREEEDHYALTGALPPLAIPATLQDSLMARLDRLGTAREVAQLGATLGREFTYEVIQAVSPVDEPTLQHGLAQLIDAELLYRRGLPPRAHYLFKHALIQETAYQSLLKSTRQRYHQRVAQALAEQFPETVDTQPELLAHHYTEAGLSEQAIPYWQQAGQRAIERSANVEAISHLTKGLEVLKALPETPARVQHELALRLALGPPLLMIKGDTAPEVEQTYTRAQALCQQVGDSPQRFSALGGLWRFYLNRPRLRAARDLGEQCFILAQSLQDPACLLEAHLMLGSTLFFLGEPVSAREHLEQGIALYAPRQSHSRAFSSGIDPGVACLCRMAWTLWMLGYPDQALIRSHEALTLARELAHPFSLVVALHYAAVLHQSRREVKQVQEWAEATIALASEQGFPYWLGVGMCMRGWAVAEHGAPEEGIGQLCQGMETLQAMGSDLAKTHLLLRLAEAYGKGGQAEAGLRVVDEALAAVHENAERYFEAELYRRKGELLLQQAMAREGTPAVSLETSLVSEAETCLRQALDIVHRQGAKSLELRAVMSLCGVWQQRGKGAEAGQMLAGIYEWFTEGFDTPDLQEAKALLDALA